MLCNTCHLSPMPTARATDPICHLGPLDTVSVLGQEEGYNSVQMFEPFQDRNPHLFGTVSLSWIVMKSILKTYSFNLFWTKPLRKKIPGQNLDFWKSNFQFLRWNCFFLTNMENNAAVTLHFKDLAVQNYLFLKDVCICWWKISNCSQKHFWWLWSFSF